MTLFLGGDQKKAKLDYLKFAGLLNIDLGPSQRVKLQLGPSMGHAFKRGCGQFEITPGCFQKR